MPPHLKVLELFSGIGGMHTALKLSELPGEVVAAIDINSVANGVYAHNFPHVKVLRKNIQKVTPAFVAKLGVNTILMSPPCQPFTRVGNKKDLDDKRSVPLVHILNILPELGKIRYILVENVTGFECSEAGDQLRASVTQSGFEFRELMISPLQLGVPNCRERYYMIAVRKPAKFIKDIPPREELDSEKINELLGNLNTGNKTPTRVSDILELPDDSDAYDDFLIPEDILRKRAWILDIASKSSTRTCCFTKSYTHYVEGTGSVYCPFDKETVAEVYGLTENIDQRSLEYLETLKKLRLRFFTPREVQRTLCFPDSFDYPAEVTRKQKYRLLGNSINVNVVSRLIQTLVHVTDS